MNVALAFAAAIAAAAGLTFSFIGHDHTAVGLWALAFTIQSIRCIRLDRELMRR